MDTGIRPHGAVENSPHTACVLTTSSSSPPHPPSPPPSSSFPRKEQQQQQQQNYNCSVKTLCLNTWYLQINIFLAGNRDMVTVILP